MRSLLRIEVSEIRRLLASDMYRDITIPMEVWNNTLTKATIVLLIIHQQAPSWIGRTLDQDIVSIEYLYSANISNHHWINTSQTMTLDVAYRKAESVAKLEASVTAKQREIN